MQKFSKMDIFIGIILILAMMFGVQWLEVVMGLPIGLGTFVITIIAMVIGFVVGKRALNRAKELEKEHTPTNWQIATDPEFKNLIHPGEENVYGDEKSFSRGLVTPRIYYPDVPRAAPRGCTSVMQTHDDLGYIESNGRYAEGLDDLATGVVVGMVASELVEAVVECTNDTDTSGGGDSYEPSGGGSD